MQVCASNSVLMAPRAWQTQTMEQGKFSQQGTCQRAGATMHGPLISARNSAGL